MTTKQTKKASKSKTIWGAAVAGFSSFLTGLVAGGVVTPGFDKDAAIVSTSALALVGAVTAIIGRLKKDIKTIE